MAAAMWLKSSSRQPEEIKGHTGVNGHQKVNGSTEGNLFTHPGNPHGGAMLIDGKVPRHGDIMKMPQLALTFKVRITSHNVMHWNVAKPNMESI